LKNVSSGYTSEELDKRYTNRWINYDLLSRGAFVLTLGVGVVGLALSEPIPAESVPTVSKYKYVNSELHSFRGQLKNENTYKFLSDKELSDKMTEEHKERLLESITVLAKDSARLHDSPAYQSYIDTRDKTRYTSAGIFLAAALVTTALKVASGNYKRKRSNYRKS